MIDHFNHCDNLQTQADLFHTKLHLTDNKIYKHKHDFDIVVDNVKAKNNGRPVDESKQFLNFSQRGHYDVSDLYSKLKENNKYPNLLTDEEVKVAKGK